MREEADFKGESEKCTQLVSNQYALHLSPHAHAPALPLHAAGSFMTGRGLLPKLLIHAITLIYQLMGLGCSRIVSNRQGCLCESEWE